jgi:transcriptional regulator with XRE-family HTH domain
MDLAKRKRLEAAGWTVGSAADFLGLSPEESVYVELKLRLSDALRERRKSRRLSQESLAGLLRSSQSRVAKMEAGDPSVSIDLLIRALFATGASRAELARIMVFSECTSIEEERSLATGEVARATLRPQVSKLIQPNQGQSNNEPLFSVSSPALHLVSRVEMVNADRDLPLAS